MFEKTLLFLDQESQDIQAEIVARVEAEFQAQQACQQEEAEHSQLQDKQLRDHILRGEEARGNDLANYKSEMARYKKEREAAERDQQGQHEEAEMARLHDIMIEVKAQVGAISAQRSVAPTEVSDNRERRGRNTDGAQKKQSNPTPELEGGNGGGEKPLTTMHGAGDPDLDNSDENDDDEGHDPKGGPSRGEKQKGRVGPDPETRDEEEDVIDVMAKAIAQEQLMSSKRPAEPPHVFKISPTRM